MSTPRDDIFATIRRSLGVNGSEQTRRKIVADRLQRAPTGVIPQRGRSGSAKCLAIFRREAEAAFATVADVATNAEVPGTVAGYLRSHNLPAAVRMGNDSRLGNMPWAATALEVSQGPSVGRDLNAGSHAFGGVGETGTLVMVSGPENPSTLNFFAGQPHRRHRSGGCCGRLRDSVRSHSRYVWQGRDAAHRKSHYRPLPLSRHRANPFARRARTAPATYRCCN